MKERIAELESNRAEKWTSEQLGQDDDVSCKCVNVNQSFVQDDPLTRSISSNFSVSGDFTDMIKRMKVRVPSIGSHNDCLNDASMFDSTLIDEQLLNSNGRVIGKCTCGDHSPVCVC